MAKVVVNNPVGSNVIYRTQYTSVWVKPYYTQNWRYVPYMFPESSTESAAPSDSEATFTWDYGRYVNLWGDPGSTLLPLNIQNWYIQILVHTVYGTYISWIGVVVSESMSEAGIDVQTGLPRGEQIIECRGLEYLLERRNLIGTFVGDETTGVYLPKTRDFNVSSSRRESMSGNRSATTNAISGTYLFSADGNKWSNHDIAKYIIAAFQPWLPIGSNNGAVTYVPQFRLAGQTSALRDIFEEHRLHGRTVRECLNALIDRRRGLGWKIMTDGVGPIYIYVFSLSQYPISGNTQNVPANRNQININLHDDKWIQANYRIVSTSQVDEIIVESEEPIKTCATVRFTNGSLEPAWDPSLDLEFALTEEQEAYKALAENIYNNWDNVHTLTYYPNIQFSDFTRYATVQPSLFSFLLVGATDPFEAFLIGFNNLDTDGDGSLSKTDLEWFSSGLTYQQVSEELRATDKYASVFSQFQVPKNWNWEGWSPFIGDSGNVRLDIPGSYWNHDNSPMRFLPFMEDGYALDAEREYMEPFAIVERPSATRDAMLALATYGASTYTYSSAAAVHPSLTQAQFDEVAGDTVLTLAEIYSWLAANPPQYIQLDKAQQLNYPSCSLRMGDSGLKIVVKSEANHVFALNHELGGSFERAPEFDYRTLAATIFFETDMMPRVGIPIYNSIYRIVNDEGETVTIRERTPTGRQIYIQVPGKEVWCVAPYTVVGLDGTQLRFFNNGEAGILRDDTPDLKYIARLAWMWYSQQRASVEFDIKNQLTFFQIGDLVRATHSGRTYERVGTCVTSIRRNYQDGTHQVSTGYGELDPVSFVGVASR